MSLPTRVSRSGYDSLSQAQRDWEYLMTRFLGQHEDRSSAPYAVDVREDADHFYVECDLPGFTKEDVNITLENQTLTIDARKQHQSEQKAPKGDFLLHERRYDRYARSFALPPTVNEQGVQAKLGDGVLVITLNKREETKRRRVDVN